MGDRSGLDIQFNLTTDKGRLSLAIPHDDDDDHESMKLMFAHS